MGYKREQLLISGNVIKRCQGEKEEEWFYCVYDVIRYITKTNLPYNYLSKLYSRDEILWSRIREQMVKITIEKELRSYEIVCLNLSGLWWLFKALPDKYEWRKKGLKIWIE